MAKIKLDTMLDEVSCRLGNVVYSEWKGIKYARKWVKAHDANTEAQAGVRRTFASLIKVWKQLPDNVKEGWNYHAKGRPLTGYNMYFMENFDAMKTGSLLELSRGTGMMVPANLTASMNGAGEISVSFEAADAVQVDLFVQGLDVPEGRPVISSFTQLAGGAMPVVLAGFDPQSEYNVYAVAFGPLINGAIKVSPSAAVRVVK